MIRSVALAALAMLLLSPLAVKADDRLEVSRLMQTAAKGTAEEKAEAIDDLARYGERAEPALPTLVAALENESADLKWRAARTLGSMGEAALPALPSLRKAVKSNEPRVAAYAAYALGRIGETAAEAAPDIIPLIVSKDAVTRRAARDALRRIRAPREITLPLMAQALEEANPDDVVPALRTLSELGEEALPAVEAALKHPRACYWGCLVVADLGPKAKSTVPLVADVLEHRDPECRLQAAVALGEIGEDARSAEQAVLDALKNDEFDGVRAAAAYALVKMKSDDSATVKALLDARADDDQLVQVVSAWALIQLAPNNTDLVRESLDVVLKGLRSDDPKVRVTAARGLIESKAPRELVGPQLVAALQDANDELIIQIVEGLAGIGPDAVPAVMEAMKNPELRRVATLIINRIGPDAKSAVPGLVEALQTTDKDLELRRELQFALGGIGPAAAPAVPELVESLASDNAEVRRSAAYALGKIGAESKPAVPALRKLVASEDRYDRIAAVWALLKIDASNPRLRQVAVPLLIGALDHERMVVRLEAAEALGEIGSDAKPAVPALKGLLEDPSPLVQAAAKSALAKIGE
ncbi:MAG: HEAT repeat domain-containing protein [Planctomycetales bacterium]|nr:HEAT repeat domain-containing protein [Planctomycetales bacterium]